jgi:hypothetical protein
MVTVTNPTAAAIIWPMKYDAFKSEPKIGRSLGYPSSPIMDDAAMRQNGNPNPRIRRATIYMPAAQQD